MRVVPIVLALVLVSPLAGALLAPPAAPAPLPADVKDADVLMLLAREWGVAHPTRLPIPEPDLDALPLDALVMRLGARAGMTLAPEDVADFRALHPSVAAPVATLLLAVEEAWTLRDRAFASWTEEDFERARLSLETGQSPDLLTEQQKEDLINAAILLTDTIESVVIPAANAAADAGVWPPLPIADPVGVLRIGSSGNDVELMERIVQIDARGDDHYDNNAGGARPQLLVADLPYYKHVAVSIDLEGDDTYVRTRDDLCQGAGEFAVGVLYDTRGDDHYHGRVWSAGSGIFGVGVFRDLSGNDYQRSPTGGTGSGHDGLGYYRDDAGDDEFLRYGSGGGYGSLGAGFGIFWDRGGLDTYAWDMTRTWGYGYGGGKGWFVDEGPSLDVWPDIRNYRVHPHVCNDCTWSAGGPSGSVTGKGNDNRGGLAYLLAWQWQGKL